MGKLYTIASSKEVDGKVLVRRVSDNMVARCYLRWLELVTGQTEQYVPVSKVKANRLECLDWTVTEEE